MDISTIIPDDREIEIKHPSTGEGVGFFVSLRPMHSDEIKKAERAIANRALKLRARGKTFTADEIEENVTSLMCIAVSGWRFEGDTTFEGEQPKCTPENIRRIVSREWIREQIDQELGDVASFFQK